jgi:hypothetical protein
VISSLKEDTDKLTYVSQTINDDTNETNQIGLTCQAFGFSWPTSRGFRKLCGVEHVRQVLEVEWGRREMRGRESLDHCYARSIAPTVLEKQKQSNAHVINKMKRHSPMKGRM